MNGRGLLFLPEEPHGKLLGVYDAPPPLQLLRDAVGGDLELVPGFDAIGADHRRCVAFCDEHGKLDYRHQPDAPFNLVATLLWEAALQHNHRGVLRDAHGDWVDWLAGPVLVLYGDDEFMESLQVPQELYCWQERAPDGRWGVITAVIPFLPQLGATLLCARDRKAMEVMRPIAEQHAQRTGNPVRLARYRWADTLVTIGGHHE